MKRVKYILTSLLGLLCACLIGGVVKLQSGNGAPPPVTVVADTPTASAQAATPITYNGEPTGRYGIYKYAGRNEQAWVQTTKAAWVDYGADESYVFGSDGTEKSGLVLTFEINSTVAGGAYLWLYIGGDLDGDLDGDLTQTVTYQGKYGETQLWNDTALNMQSQRIRSGVTDAHFPVVLYMADLRVGTNTVTLTMGTNYEAWFYSFAVSPTGGRTSSYTVDTVDVVGCGDEHAISLYASTDGNMSADYEGFGLDAFGESANYGKVGSITYNLNVLKAGIYKVGLWAQTGLNPLSARMHVTINGNLRYFDGKDYLQLKPTETWVTGSDVYNEFYVHFQKGLNTFTLSNALTYVDPNNKSVELSKENGGVAVSNWWVHNTFDFTLFEACDLTVAANEARANVGQQVDKRSLTVQYTASGNTKTLSAADYRTTIPFASVVNDGTQGNASVIYTRSITDGSTTKQVSLYRAFTATSTNEGLPYTADGAVVFDGENSTGKKSYYLNASVSNDTTNSDCLNRIFYVINKQLSDGGYRIGSNGKSSYENRQITFTIKIDNTGEAGTYLFKSYAITNGETSNYCNANITVAGSEKSATSAINMFSYSNTVDVATTYVYALALEEGENTVTIQMQDYYGVWFDEFEICPLDTAMKFEYSVLEGARAGKSIVNTEDGTWYPIEAQTASISYWVNLPYDGNYALVFKTTDTTDKTVSLLIDDEVSGTVFTGTKTVVDAALTAGIRKITVQATNSDVALCGMNVTYAGFDVATASIRVRSDGENAGQMNNGIRFHVAMDKAWYDTLSQASDFETGTIIMMKHKLSGELTLSTENVRGTETTGTWFTREDDSSKMYSVAYIENIPESAYQKAIVVRAYVKANGVTYYTAWSPYWSMAHVAEQAYDMSADNPALQERLKAYFGEYTVTFVDTDGTTISTQTIWRGSSVTEAPTISGDKTIVGWTLDGKTYDLNTSVTGSITLTAVYEGE